MFPLHGLRRAVPWLALVLGFGLLGGCASLPGDVIRPVSHTWAQPDATALGRAIEAQRPSGAPPGRSAFALLDDADTAYSARLALADAAERTLDLQYYAIQADATTDRLFRHLRAAAARGVRVRVLLDDFNAVGADARVLQLAFVPNVEVRLFNPLPGGRASSLLRVITSLDDVPRIQRRMHNKLFLADGAVAITGGRNLGETYFGRSAGDNFVDMDLLASGAVARELGHSFDGFWNHPLAYPVPALLTPDQIAAAQPAPAVTAPAASPAEPTPRPPVAAPAPPLPGPLDLRSLPLTWASGAVLADTASKLEADPDDVDDARDTVIDGLLQLLGQARREVWIVSPYFVPGDRVMAALTALRARGVAVRVLTNSLASNDAPLAHVGYARRREALLKAGVELFELRSAQRGRIGGLGSSGSPPAGSPTGSRANLHAKLLVRDGRLLVIGSMNLDLRSQLQNSEVAVAVRSGPLARAVVGLVEATVRDGAYAVALDADGRLTWRAPEGTVVDREPDAGVGLQLLLKLIGPLAPDEML